jgi:succinate dehydrogenase / fumarate reductase, cytochrome b subunit
MANILSSTIGRKVFMSLAGIFLLTFLVVHLGINITLVFGESQDTFNIAAHFMGTNPVIKVMEFILFGGFIIHMVWGVIVSINNWIARGSVRYKVANHSQLSFFSKYMFHTAVIITLFLVIHLFDFYLKAKVFNGAEQIIINGKEMHDLGSLVIEKFKMPGYVIFYVVAMIILSFHLHHGFQSAFQTLGLNHKTYTPMIKVFGLAYSILVPLGFVIIPVYIYFIY